MCVLTRIQATDQYDIRTSTASDWHGLGIARMGPPYYYDGTSTEPRAIYAERNAVCVRQLDDVHYQPADIHISALCGFSPRCQVEVALAHLHLQQQMET